MHSREGAKHTETAPHLQDSFRIGGLTSVLSEVDAGCRNLAHCEQRTGSVGESPNLGIISQHSEVRTHGCASRQNV